MYLALYGNMVLNSFLRFFVIFQKMSQKCEQFSYGPFFEIFGDFWSKLVPLRRLSAADGNFGIAN